MIKQQSKTKFNDAGELNFVNQIQRELAAKRRKCNFAAVNCVKISGGRSTQIFNVNVHIQEQIINLKVSPFKCTLKVKVFGRYLPIPFHFNLLFVYTCIFCIFRV